MKFGIIGCGAIARRGHLSGLKRVDEAEVIAVADIDLKIAKQVAKEFKIPHYYKDYQLMLSREDIDTVVITAPTPMHARIAIDSAKAGKNIVVEKPLASSLAEAFEVKEAIMRNNVKLSIIQNFRYCPCLKISKFRLSQGYFGKIVSFHGVAHNNFPTSWTTGTWLYYEKGVLLDFAPHLVDAVLWLLDTTATRVYSLGRDFTGFSDFINHATMLVELENGASGSLEISWLAGNITFFLDVEGTGGGLKIDFPYDYYEERYGAQTPIDDVRHFSKRMWKIIMGVLSGTLLDKTLKTYPEIYRDIIMGFKKGKVPVPIDDGIKSLAVLEAAYRSIKEGRSIYIPEMLKSYI
jgi:predicted dehydrogenase